VQVLQCPECGEKHPLSGVPDAAGFACRGCGRTLKVPASLARAGSAPAPAPASAPTSVLPAVDPAPAATIAPTAAVAPTTTAPAAAAPTDPTTTAPGPPPGGPAPVPVWARILLWVVAVPAGFLIVFLVARFTGLMSANQYADMFLAEGAGRFWPLARLLPFVAVVVAGIVQGGVVLLARRGRRQRPSTP